MIASTFWSFTKKQNSTKIPSTGGTTINIELKDDTSIITPRVILKYSGNPTTFNYCQIATFNRYYWITDWTFESGLWTASLKCDVLGSFRSAINSSAQYVKRSYSDCDGDIIDVYPRVAGSSIYMSSTNTGLTSSLSAATYIIGVTSADSTQLKAGTTVFYALGYDDLRRFLAFLTSMSYTTFTDISDNLAKWICNPLQWIKSIMVFPIPFSSAASFGWTSLAGGNIYFGSDDQGSAFSFTPTGTAYIVSSAGSMNITYTIPIIKHPQYANLGVSYKYLQAEPYSFYSLVIPPFGKLQIPSAVLYDKSNLYVLIRADPVTGGATLQIGESDLHYGAVMYAEAQMGVPLPVDSAIVDFGAAGVSMLVGGAANAVSPIMNGANLEGIMTSFIDGALSSVSRVQTVSQGGKLCDLGYPPALFLEAFDSVGRDPVNYGFPLCQTKTLSTLTGFILCDNAEMVAANATYDELREIENYLNSGFFNET